MTHVLVLITLVEGRIFINVAGSIQMAVLPVLTQGSCFCDLALESDKCKLWHVIVEHIHLAYLIHSH